jgi:hypothetical protein
MTDFPAAETRVTDVMVTSHVPSRDHLINIYNQFTDTFDMGSDMQTGFSDTPSCASKTQVACSKTNDQVSRNDCKQDASRHKNTRMPISNHPNEGLQ